MWQLVPQPTLHPNCCFLCNATRGAMIDTGIRGRFMNNASIGACYICVDNCARLFLRVLGAHTGSEYAELLKQFAASEEENKELRQIVKEQKPLVDGIIEAARRPREPVA